MKIRVMAAIAVALLTVVSTSAQAKHHHRHYRHYSHRAVHRIVDRLPEMAAGSFIRCDRYGCRDQAAKRIETRRIERRTAGDGVTGGRRPGFPHAFCGAEASYYVFGVAKRDLWLAANWFRFPRAAPAPGMAAVRLHHVFIIISVNGDGTVLAHDGNSGNGLTREHTVSLHGYVVVDPHGYRVASR